MTSQDWIEKELARIAGQAKRWGVLRHTLSVTDDKVSAIQHRINTYGTINQPSLWAALATSILYEEPYLRESDSRLTGDRFADNLTLAFFALTQFRAAGKHSGHCQGCWTRSLCRSEWACVVHRFRKHALPAVRNEARKCNTSDFITQDFAHDCAVMGQVMHDYFHLARNPGWWTSRRQLASWLQIPWKTLRHPVRAR